MISAGLATLETLPPAPPARRLAAPGAPLDPAVRGRFTEAVARARNWR